MHAEQTAVQDASSPPPVKGELAELLEAEHRLDALLDDARVEAQRIVAEAQAAARLAEQELDAELQSALAAVTAEAESERQRQVDSLRAEIHRRITALDAVTDAQIAALAGYVLERVLGAESQGSH